LSPSPEQVEYAEMLLRRANGDLSVCRALGADMDVDDGPIGFHAQQAVEKALKIALVLADVELPRTHDLEFLVRLVRGSGVDIPADLSSPEWLTPWAADFRYGDPVALDRPAACAAAESAIAWAESRVAAVSGEH
jgi:HEPN domain-containing protein